jgi:hypothetical protein
MPVKQHTEPTYGYLRQTVRTSNAAVVAEGGTKPTSVFSVVRIEDSLDVVAHQRAVPKVLVRGFACVATILDD